MGINEKSSYTILMENLNRDLWQYYQSFDANVAMFPYGVETLSRILNHNPKTILEFGCNNGKNLVWLHNRTKGVSIKGIDFSVPAITRAMNKGLDVIVGDQTSLKEIPNKSIDVIFTISVLDHIPETDEIVEDFERIAKKAVYLTETNEVKTRFYFPHDYIGYGYKSVKRIKNPENPIGNGAIYDIWEKIL